MSLQSDAAKAHIEVLLNAAYIPEQFQKKIDEWLPRMTATAHGAFWMKEYKFAKPRRWAFDYAVPAHLCAIELDGGTFQGIRTGHSSGVGLRGWREKHNAAMSLGWRVWHYSPEEVIKAGRKIVGNHRGSNQGSCVLATVRNPAR